MSEALNTFGKLLKLIRKEIKTEWANISILLIMTQPIMSHIVWIRIVALMHFV